MPKDKTENHEKILKIAREEFSRNGFENTSIRDIADKVGISSAALYRHCKDKEDLFCQLVKDSVNEMKKWVKTHLQYCYTGFEDGMSWENILSNSSELDLIRDVIYPRKEDFKLIFFKSKGTKYENFLHKYIESEQKGMIEALQKIEKATGKKIDITELELHVILTAYTSALLEPIFHDFTKEEMEHSIEITGKFFMPGWKKIMGF